MRNIGGNVGDARLQRGGEKRRGGCSCLCWFCVRVCVCLLLAVYLCVCFDISVSYRAAASLWERGQRRKGLKVFIITAFLQWREEKELGCKSWCLLLCVRACLCVGTHLCLALPLSPTFSSRPPSVTYGRVILTWSKSPDKFRLISSFCAVLEAEAKCLYDATTTHG